MLASQLASFKAELVHDESCRRAPLGADGGGVAPALPLEDVVEQRADPREEPPSKACLCGILGLS